MECLQENHPLLVVAFIRESQNGSPHFSFPSTPARKLGVCMCVFSWSYPRSPSFSVVWGLQDIYPVETEGHSSNWWCPLSDPKTVPFIYPSHLCVSPVTECLELGYVQVVGPFMVVVGKKHILTMFALIVVEWLKSKHLTAKKKKLFCSPNVTSSFGQSNRRVDRGTASTRGEGFDHAAAAPQCADHRQAGWRGVRRSFVSKGRSFVFFVFFFGGGGGGVVSERIPLQRFRRDLFWGGHPFFFVVRLVCLTLTLYKTSWGVPVLIGTWVQREAKWTTTLFWGSPMETIFGGPLC